MGEVVLYQNEMRDRCFYFASGAAWPKYKVSIFFRMTVNILNFIHKRDTIPELGGRNRSIPLTHLRTHSGNNQS